MGPDSHLQALIQAVCAAAEKPPDTVAFYLPGGLSPNPDGDQPVSLAWGNFGRRDNKNDAESLFCIGQTSVRCL